MNHDPEATLDLDDLGRPESERKGGPTTMLPTTAPTGVFVAEMNDRFAPLDIGMLRREAVRELELRERNYPRWIDARKLDAKKGSRQIAMQRAIVAVLFQLENMK